MQQPYCTVRLFVWYVLLIFSGVKLKCSTKSCTISIMNCILCSITAKHQGRSGWSLICLLGTASHKCSCGHILEIKTKVHWTCRWLTLGTLEPDILSHLIGPKKVDQWKVWLWPPVPNESQKGTQHVSELVNKHSLALVIKMANDEWGKPIKELWI